MLQLKTFINQELVYLDLFDNEDIQIDYSFAEIQNITAKNSSFSRTFSLPGSKTNNDVFQHYYDLNTSLTDYDVRDAFDAILTYDGYDIFEGYIRLENVSITNKEVIYNVTFYAQIGTLAARLGDKVLADVPFSGLAHPYNQEVITRSLYDFDFSGGTEPYEDGRVTYMLANYGYDYDVDKNIITGSTPIIDFRSGQVPGYFDYIGTPLRFYYLKPAVQVKWLYEKIVNDAGFVIDSEFLNTAYFKRFYLPLTFNNDSLYLNQSVIPQWQFTQDYRTGDTVPVTAITWNNLPSGATQNLERVLETPAQIDNISANTFSNYTFKVPTAGNYKFKITIGGWNSETTYEFQPFQSICAMYLHQIELGGVDGKSGTTLYKTVDIVTNPGQAYWQTFTFNVYLSNNYSYAWDYDGYITNFYAYLNYFRVELLDGPRYIAGNVNLALELPDTEQKQIDFISGINQRFNLVLNPKPYEPQILKIEPVIDYVGKGDVLDWSRLLDYNQTINIAPTTNVINGTLSYLPEDDEDFGNTEFKKTNNLNYGTRFVQLDLEYKSEVTEFIDGFSNAVDDVLSNVNTPNITLPAYYITREENNEGQPELFYNARKTLPRIVFRGLNLPAKNVGFFTTSALTQTNVFYLENRTIDVFPSFNRFVTYPFGVTGLTHAVNFNKFHRFNQTEFDFSCYEDLYDVYYDDYITDLTSSDNRVLIGKFWLEKSIIADLKGDERIYVNGNYYRINNINGLNLTNDTTTEVELIKLTQSYETHRVRYYRLENCSDGSDIRYGNTDLNFTLFAYIGKRIKIGENCYTIYADIYRDNVTYETFEVGFQTDSFLPLFYDNCACNTLIDSVDIYNELDCQTLQPIPDYPTGSTEYYYVIERCDLPAQLIVRYDQYILPGTSVRISTFPSICYFVVSQTTIQSTTDITFTYSSCTECSENVPTPTPTPTASITPTPTPAAFSCDCVEFTTENELPYFDTLRYTKCNGDIEEVSIGAGQYWFDCGCNGTITFNSFVSIDGPCEVSSSPTPTPTKTPTKTPTPTPTISGGEGPIPPEPSEPAASPSPTPSPTCSYKTWIVVWCSTGTCDGVCECQGMNSISVYTDCSVTSITSPSAEIYTNSTLTNPFTADFLVGGVIYNSTGSGVSVVCNEGGPC